MPRFFFADDSRQRTPSRPGMGSLVGVGGFGLPVDRVRSAELALRSLCREFEFPAGELFKWSPGRDDWMRDNLKAQDRTDFFRQVMDVLAANGASANVVIEDTKYKPAISPDKKHELDATVLFLERCHNQCGRFDGLGFVLVDRPAGAEKERDAFLAACLGEIEAGTRWVKFEHLVLPPVPANSSQMRLLQAADVLTSATVAFVSGQNQVAPEVFERVLPMLETSDGRRGGVGLKLHPDIVHGNLYYWLLGDKTLYNRTRGKDLVLPHAGFQYSKDPGGDGKQATAREG